MTPHPAQSVVPTSRAHRASVTSGGVDERIEAFRANRRAWPALVGLLWVNRVGWEYRGFLQTHLAFSEEERGRYVITTAQTNWLPLRHLAVLRYSEGITR